MLLYRDHRTPIEITVTGFDFTGYTSHNLTMVDGEEVSATITGTVSGDKITIDIADSDWTQIDQLQVKGQFKVQNTDPSGQNNIVVAGDYVVEG